MIASKQGYEQKMKVNKELIHPIHPHHKLKLEYTEIPFNCDGCKEAGIGLNYKCQCQSCQFHLHKICALAPPSVHHPFYKKCHFQLHNQPPGAIPRRCDACQDQVLGFVYHCTRCGFDLHPCCVNLPPNLNDGEHNLNLRSKLSGPCCCCGRKGSGWAYGSQCKMYNLHLACVQKMFVESWEAMYLNVDVDKVRELETRIPSLKDTMKVNRDYMSKSCEIVGSVLSIIVSAILGDPTNLIAGVICGLISK